MNSEKQRSIPISLTKPVCYLGDEGQPKKLANISYKTHDFHFEKFKTNSKYIWSCHRK